MPAIPHPVTVVRHGESFTDPYAWLRNRDDPAVSAYLEEENALSAEALRSSAPLADRIYQEMLGRIKETDLSVPVRRGEWWYYSRTEAGKQYAIHCRRPGPEQDSPETILVDLNQEAQGKSFMALGDLAVDDSGRLMAISLDATGYRQYTLSLRGIGEAPDQFNFTPRERVTSVAWDRSGFFLFWSEEDPVTKRSWRVWRTDLRTNQDHLVFEEADESFSVHVGRTRSREWLVLETGSHTTSEALVIPADTPEQEPELILPRQHEIEYELDHHGDYFYLRINDTGRNFRLIRLPTRPPRSAERQEVIPHRSEVMLEGIDAFSQFLVLSEREAGLTQLTLYSFDDRSSRRIDFPEPVYEVSLHSNPEWEVEEIRFNYQSLVTPASVFEYQVASGERLLLKQQEVMRGYDPSRFVSERMMVPAADGTLIPVSLVRRADTPVDGSAPGLLHGYGSYGYSYPVNFSSNRLSLLERGMVVAIAHIRGGGELGKAWHDAGRMADKMNTFTDFIAVADELQRNGSVARGRLAIEGGSAGGLLMGAVTNLRPDLFAAVLTQVPFVDVLNTMSDPTLPLTVGEYEEWGNPEIAEQFAWIRGYCPYTNLHEGSYPAVLVRTAFNDSQVMYWEPAKYVARLRTLRQNSNPLLLLTNMGAGHGGASGRYDRLREIAVDYAWICERLGVS